MGSEQLNVGASQLEAAKLAAQNAKESNGTGEPEWSEILEQADLLNTQQATQEAKPKSRIQQIIDRLLMIA